MKRRDFIMTGAAVVPAAVVGVAIGAVSEKPQVSYAAEQLKPILSAKQRIREIWGRDWPDWPGINAQISELEAAIKMLEGAA